MSTESMSDGSLGDDATPMSVMAAALFAMQRPLLLATDVDGTLSPIAEAPGQAALVEGVLATLERLDTRDDVTVAVVSGRSIPELIQQFGFPSSMHLVGSHGAEFARSIPLTEHEAALLARIHHELGAVAARVDGSRVEGKPFAAALHVRGVDAPSADRAIADARQAIGALEGVTVHPGHMVLEVSVRTATKAQAVALLRRNVGPASTMFIGDDLADEGVFEALGDTDLGIKIGSGPTSAGHRLPGPLEVAAMLTAFEQLLDR